MSKLRRKAKSALIGAMSFDDLFADFYRDAWPILKRSTDGFPVTDLYSDKDGYQVIKMALAGFNKDNINISVDDNNITVSSEATQDGYADGEQRYRRIAKRSFSKSFRDFNGNLELSKTEASFEDGLLTIRIPTLKQKNKVSIKIK